MDTQESDETLMLLYQAGDAAAFDRLYARHRTGLFRFITRQCHVRGHAEELFQEVWMNLIKAREHYRVEAQFRTYLYTLAHNKLMDYFRRHAHADLALFEHDGDAEPAVSKISASRVDEPHVRFEAHAQGEAILRLLQKLPSPQREAFLLHHEGDMEVAEIAQAVGISFEAAKSRLRYAIAKLRAGLLEFV